jgi:hypothetical protein
LVRPGSFSAVSRVGLGCSLPFGPASHSKSFDLLCFAIALFICARLLRLRTGWSFVSFLCSFLFVVVAVLIHVVPSWHFPHLLQSFCFSVRFPRLFVLFLPFILSYIPDLFFVVFPGIWFSSVRSVCDAWSAIRIILILSIFPQSA